MTRKRFVKLLMAEGYSRNKATSIARETVTDGYTYELRLLLLQIGNDFPDVLFPDLKAAIDEVVAMLTEIIPAVFNAIAELIPVAVQQASKRIAALQQQMQMEATNEQSE